MPVAQLAVVVGIVTAVFWIVVPGTIAIVVSIVSGGLIAFRAVSDDHHSNRADSAPRN